MTAHELAKKLLEGPDKEIMLVQVNERDTGASQTYYFVFGEVAVPMPLTRWFITPNATLP